MDFVRIRTKEVSKKAGRQQMYPAFVYNEKIEDLMVRGGKFYAVWDEPNNIWSRESFAVRRLVDDALEKEAKERSEQTGIQYDIQFMWDDESGSWKRFIQFLDRFPDKFQPLDSKLVFSNSRVEKKDYASKRLPYSLAEGDISSWDTLVSTLYGPEQRAKIEWAIGSIVAGDSKWIQKFFVFYGAPATGKSTILNIIEWLFEGYVGFFEAGKIASSRYDFATSIFANNPLVAIQHDGDLSRIDDNTELNSIIAHETMLVNEKYKSKYPMKLNAMLFIGSNQPVKISDAKSGIIRRLIDVTPTGNRLAPDQYHILMDRIGFELGAIAYYCLQVYQGMGPNYYNSYRPQEMMLQTDIFYNFIEAYFDVFKEADAVSLKDAYEWYREWCEDSGISKPMPMYKMRGELRNYFDSYGPWRDYGEGGQINFFRGFNAEKFKEEKAPGVYILVLEETESVFDREMAECPAQLATPEGTPKHRWDRVKTILADIDTHELHYVKVPANHIVIDFDLEGSLGKSALERNLDAASHWPPTYAEISKSGQGVHLHYNYDGDTRQLASEYAPGIEIKVYRGDSALRRRLTYCNNIAVSHIASKLPLKEKREVLSEKTIASEKGLRELIERNLRKEIHAGTKPSVDFIKKILDDAYESGMPYDVTDLRSRITAFAANSTHQASTALKVVKEMKWRSEGMEEKGEQSTSEPVTSGVDVTDNRLVFFDVEVYPNLFVVCWKYQGDPNVVKMINPKPHEVEALFKFKLVGFYNRRFDNHILYAASLGATNEELYKLTAKLIDGNKDATYGQAYNLSYADIYDFSSEKKSLKKFEIELGILHMELDFPWDKPVPEKDWGKVVDYCANDVRATEAVFEARKGDYVARQILAELSGLTVNDTTQNHTAKIILGKDAKSQRQFVYTDLREEFPGYTFELGKSSYKGEDPGEGGYVYAEPGMYEHVGVLDVISMHPTTIEVLNVFGPYTKKFSELKQARVYIKRGDFAKAREMLNGRLTPYLQDESTAEQLAYALKIVINSVYGLTSAKFDNPFRDIRNVDNIVAKRGALFMIDLKYDLQKAGYTVCHIKTDSVKIPNITQEAIAMVITIGLMYKYEFEHEITYDKLCLVNDAVYIARKDDKWTAVGAQFQHPYIFKTLFTGEELTFDDFCEARSVVKGTMYLDKEQNETPNLDHMRHLGRTGRFVPVVEGGGVLYRVADGKFYAVTGTKGHLWMEAHVAQSMGDRLKIDMSYFDKLRADAIETIEKFGSFEEFINGSR